MRPSIIIWTRFGWALSLLIWLLSACQPAGPTTDPSPALTQAMATRLADVQQTSAAATQAMAPTLAAFEQTATASTPVPVPPTPALAPLEQLMAQSKNWRIAFAISNQIICIDNGKASDGVYCLKNLEKEHGYLSKPSWSPDGQSLATADNRNIYLLAVDGSGSVNLTNNSQAVINAGPDWSPDGKYIAYSSSETQLNSGGGVYSLDIMVMSVDGKEKLNLTKSRLINTDPAWSPDGRWIAFISDREQRGKDNVPITYDLYLLAPDGSSLKKLTSCNCKTITGLTWSPDSRQIAFSEEDSVSRVSHLYVVNRENEELRQMTTGDNVIYSSPNWLPDGKLIAYKVYDKKTSSFEYRVINLESGEIFPLKSGILADGDLLPISPTVQILPTVTP